MILVLVRHARAVERTPGGRDDHRALTPAGRAHAVRLALALARRGVRFDRLLHSPMRRAVETAAPLRALCPERAVETARLAQAPGKRLLRELSGETVAAVGHEPWLSELAAWLAFRSRAKATGLRIPKGAVVVLEGHPRPGAMAIREVLSPATIVALAAGGATRVGGRRGVGRAEARRHAGTDVAARRRAR